MASVRELDYAASHAACMVSRVRKPLMFDADCILCAALMR